VAITLASAKIELASYFPAGMSDGNQTTRLNEICARFLDAGKFTGTLDRVSMTTTSAILSLPAAYQTLERLWAADYGEVPVRSKAFEFSRGGIGVVSDYTQVWPRIALDKGDTTGGIRQYQITGANNDTLTFIGLCKKRYVPVTQGTDMLVPATLSALTYALQARQWGDKGDGERQRQDWNDAIQQLRDNLGEYFGDEAMSGFLNVQPGLMEYRNLI
jgi:hypothetical protein